MPRKFESKEQEREYRRDWYSKNRIKRLEVVSLWNQKDHARDPLAHRVKRMFHDAKQRARKSGITFALRLDWLMKEAHLAHDRFGFDLMAHGVANRMSMTLDRFDNSIGYVESNTRVIPYWMNRAKGGCSIEDIEQVLAYMRG